MGKVICIYNNQSESLKTTTVISLARNLAKEGKKVLIIDTNYEADVSLSFVSTIDNFLTSLYEVIMKDVDPSKITAAVHRYIDLLPANDDLIGVDIEVIGNPEKYPAPFNLIKEKCTKLRETYDYILLDTPSNFSLLSGNAIQFADQVLIPYAPDSSSLRSLQRVIKTIKDFSKRYHPSLEIAGVFAVKVNFETTLHQQIMQETRRYCVTESIPMFETFVANTPKTSGSLSQKPEHLSVYQELLEELKKAE
ncbi:ParA family protein [Thalassorhabdus alkalitolerans]|uniref:ParA family protein n=1 Tax=Thalassorhabdus alkalitolerans TaxID=2282697 RepID=A0ABW0YH42_9BACI|nr:AAA family ATPase [Thalassobacillus sp. C254]